MRLSGESFDPAQLILTPAATGITLGSTGVTAAPVLQPNRDRYPIGVDLDLFLLVQTLDVWKKGVSDSSRAKRGKSTDGSE